MASNPNNKQPVMREKPKQYQVGIDTIERAEANMTPEEIIAVCKFSIDKYCWRKKDQDKSDFIKIIDYANLAIKQLDKIDQKVFEDWIKQCNKKAK